MPSNTNWRYQVHGEGLDYLALPYFKKIWLNVIKQAISLNPFGINVTIRQKKLFYINYPLYITIRDQNESESFIPILCRNTIQKCLSSIHTFIGMVFAKYFYNWTFYLWDIPGNSVTPKKTLVFRKYSLEWTDEGILGGFPSWVFTCSRQ